MSHADALAELALPASHCAQLAAPSLLYEPAAQFAQAAAPVVSPNLPATHSSHAAALVAAGLALALPASHCDKEVGYR